MNIWQTSWNLIKPYWKAYDNYVEWLYQSGYTLVGITMTIAPVFTILYLITLIPGIVIGYTLLGLFGWIFFYIIWRFIITFKHSTFEYREHLKNDSKSDLSDN